MYVHRYKVVLLTSNVLYLHLPEAFVKILHNGIRLVHLYVVLVINEVWHLLATAAGDQFVIHTEIVDAPLIEGQPQFFARIEHFLAVWAARLIIQGEHSQVVTANTLMVLHKRPNAGCRFPHSGLE